jgi:hypothetical protein
VSKGDRNEEIDDDILQSRADILRARDIVPPYGQEAGGESKPHEGSEETAGSSGPAETEGRKEERPGEDITEAGAQSSGIPQENGEIPRLDLAEKIMAEQRRITSIRRRAPGEGREPEASEVKTGPVVGSVEQRRPAQSDEEQTIAEIVTRDIEKLCRGGTMPDSR